MHLAFAFGEVLMFFSFVLHFLVLKSFFPFYSFFLVSFFPLSLLFFLSFFLLFAPLLFFSLSHTFLHVASPSFLHSKIIFFPLSISVMHFHSLLTFISFANFTLMSPKLVSCHLHCLSPPCTLPLVMHH